MQPNATVVFDLQDPEERAWALWIEYCLTKAGFTPRRWHEVGAVWVNDLETAVLNTDELLLVVIGPNFAPDRRYDTAWRAVIADPQRTIIPVCFDRAPALGFLASRNPLEIDGRSDPSEKLMDALAGLSGPSARRMPDQSLRVPEVRDPDELIRLRLLSRAALTSAGTVGERKFEWTPATDEARLYVRRDVQADIIADLQSGSVTVVSGRAGTGKTSLLWGLASELLTVSDHEVFFIPAVMLAPGNDSKARVTSAFVDTAIRGAKRAGSRPFVLIDTADVLVNDESAFLDFIHTVDITAGLGATVIITSRPEEASRITVGGARPIKLGPYAVTASANGQPSEFARAIAIHALSYCREPGDTSALADQIHRSAIREQNLGSMARHPLTMRMFFELYSPGIVPKTVDATDLYEKYWIDRVFRDRRDWGEDDIENEIDLTATAMTLAREMLRTGLPEAVLADVGFNKPADRVQFDRDIALLCARNVGRRDDFGSFSFFHQTFFEFAAAKYILSHSTGLDAVFTRSQQRPDDYLLLSVFEQTWILAFRHEDYRTIAANLAVSMLGGDPKEKQFSILRRALLVIAQSTSDVQVRNAVVSMVSNTATDHVLVRDYLALVPRPGRRWNPDDGRVLAACTNRPGAAWHAVIDALVRLARSDPAAALNILVTLEHTAKSKLLGPASFDRAETRTLIRMLFVHDPHAVLSLLYPLLEDDPGLRKSNVLNKLFRVLDTETPNPKFASDWADKVCREYGTKNSSQLVEAAARLHYRTILAEADSVSWTVLLGNVQTAIRSIAANPRNAPIPACAFTWGALMAVADWAGVAEQGDQTISGRVQELFELLTTVDSPEVHAQAHHGWLVGLLNSSAVACECAAHLLAEGLPASHSRPNGSRQRWADTIRRTLERSDVAPLTIAAIVTPVVAGLEARELTQTAIWTDLDLMLRIMMPAVCAGIQSAELTLASINNGGTTLNSAGNRILMQQGQNLRGLDARRSDVITFLAGIPAYVELEQLAGRDEELTLPQEVIGALLEHCRRDMRAESQILRRRAATFLVFAAARTLVPCPRWDELSELFTSSKDEVIRAQIAVLGQHSVDRGESDSNVVIAAVRARLMAPEPISELPSAHEPATLRKVLVYLLANYGSPGDVPEMTRLAFLHPIDASAVIVASGYLVPRPERDDQIALESRIELVIDFGRRLAQPGVPGRTRRDVPGAWKGILFHLLNMLDEAQLMAFIEEFPTIDEHFGARLIGCLPIRSGSQVPAVLASMSADLPGEMQLQIARILDQQTAFNAGWPDLSESLTNAQA